VTQGCVATPSIEETAVPRSSVRHISESSTYNLICIEIRLKLKLRR
jgi:hypothetical protein